MSFGVFRFPLLLQSSECLLDVFLPSIKVMGPENRVLKSLTIQALSEAAAAPSAGAPAGSLREGAPLPRPPSAPRRALPPIGSAAGRSGRREATGGRAGERGAG